MVHALRDCRPKDYWDKAGEVGYANAMFVSSTVAQHCNGRLWSVALEMAQALQLGHEACVSDFGCGDGTFANTVLAEQFRAVDGFDESEAAIARAQTSASRPNASFAVRDLTQVGTFECRHYDCVFLMGFLHHVKRRAPQILSSMREITDRLVILEPNGGHILRKALEWLPSYRAAGEDSFRAAELERICEVAGFRRVAYRRFNLFPNFTPAIVFRTLRPLESPIEQNRVLRALCTVNAWAFSSCQDGAGANVAPSEGAFGRG